MRALKSIKIRDNSTPIKNSHNIDNECFVCCKTTHQTWHVYDGDITYCLVTHYLSTVHYLLGSYYFVIYLYTVLASVAYSGGGAAAVSSEFWSNLMETLFLQQLLQKKSCLIRLYHHAKNYVMRHKIWTTM